jgi:hypothetical protein
MGDPTSEVGYTSATTGRGGHEVHKGYVVAFGDLLHSHNNYLYQAIPYLIAFSTQFIASLKQVILPIFKLSKCKAESIHRNVQHYRICMLYTHCSSYLFRMILL